MTFETLESLEIALVLSQVPPSVRTILMREDVVLAGGVVRDTIARLPVKDVDIFCHSREQAERLALELSPFARQTTFAYSVSVEGTAVQFVFYKDFTDAKDLVYQFDFRACCAGVYWAVLPSGAGHWAAVAVEGFRADCESKALRFMSQAKDAGKLTALRRALDFAAKGWAISTAEVTNIVAHWQGIPAHAADALEKVRASFAPAYGGSR